MKRLTAITLLCMLFGAALVAGKGRPAVPAEPHFPDSLRSVWLYTEAVKRYEIHGDSTSAEKLLREAIRIDSTYAPAYYELVSNGMAESPEEAVVLANKAYRLDSTNKWYHQFYGQTLLLAQRYGEALGVFRRLCTENPQDPDNYRIVAALFELQQNPYMALSTLDSAELRFGRIPLLSQMKRRMLVATHQIDKAIAEARAAVEAVPYEAENHVVLAELYGLSKKDSLALAEYDRAMEIDSTSSATLMSLADFHSDRRNFTALLAVTRRLFLSDDLPLETKIRRFEQYTSDTRFYREYYPQIHTLAMTLATRYPQDRRVVELYGQHLIASGELHNALEIYKLRSHDTPPVESYFRMVIDIESYLQRPDSVKLYVDRALTLFPGKTDFHIAKGNIFAYGKKYPEAIKTYRESLRYADSDSLRGAIWGLIGDNYHQLADSLGAKKGASMMKRCYDAYDRSLRFDPDNAMVLNNYAYFLSISDKDLERALNMSSRAIALSENNPTYLDTYAWVLFRLGRASEAKKIMQQAIALDRQNNSELMLHYGDILDALGEHFMAETYWRKALEHGTPAAEINRRIEAAKARREEARQ